MKTIKNDTRYIIKRVLIGVLVAIILFNARKCGVYADTIDSTLMVHISASNNCSGSLLWESTTGSPSTKWYCGSNSFTTSSTLSKSYEFIYFDKYNVNEFANVGSSSYNLKYFILYDSTNNIYISQTSNKNNYTNNTLTFNSSSFLLNLSTGSDFGSPGTLVPTSIFSTHAINFDTSISNFSIYNTGSYNNEFYSYNLNYLPLSNIDINNLFLIDSNIEGLTLIINDKIIESFSTFPPSGYDEIDLTNYQGVFFVPKDYNKIQCDIIGDLCNTTFDYYYQNEIKEAYFPIDNHFNIRFNSDILNSPDNPSELKQSYYTLKQEYESNPGGNGRWYSIYYAFLIYNYTNTGTPLDPNNYKSYGSAKIWYDSTLYNAYLVEDFNTYNNNICFNVSDSEICYDITGLPTLRESIEEASKTDGFTDPYDGNFLNALFDFVKLPFRMLTEIDNKKCEPLVLPLRFPTNNQDIVIPCLGDVYRHFIGQGYYNLLSSFISGIICYFCILKIIDITTDLLDPNDDKIEVVDL